MHKKQYLHLIYFKKPFQFEELSTDEAQVEATKWGIELLYSTVILCTPDNVRTRSAKYIEYFSTFEVVRVPKLSFSK